MKLHDILHEEKMETPKKTNKNEKCLENDSLQYNSQDLDQEQKVNVNPIQLNSQNIHVHVSNTKDSLNGKITGVVLMEKSKFAVNNAYVYLYFSQKCGLPVYETTSDINGNFVIEDIPPGYYILHSQTLNNLEYQSHYIKILPGQNVHQTLLLK